MPRQASSTAARPVDGGRQGARGFDGAFHPPEALLRSDAALERGLAALRQHDPAVIGPMLALTGRPPLRLRPPGFAGLAAIVVSQQVSTASARAILARLEAAVSRFEPEAWLAIPESVLLQCGLSRFKLRTLRGLAEDTFVGKPGHLVDSGWDCSCLMDPRTP